MNSARTNKNSNAYYICSYGGSGSMALYAFLKRYGRAYHVHSRQPPEYLTQVGGGAHFEWFSDQRVPEEDLKRTIVIYIFRHPTLAQISRWGHNHFFNIQVENHDQVPQIEEYVKNQVDLLKYEEFFDGYVYRRLNKNYNIIALNYHRLWKNLPSVLQALDIRSTEIINFPPKKEGHTSWISNPHPSIVEGLNLINFSLIKKIKKMEAISIITPK